MVLFVHPLIYVTIRLKVPASKKKKKKKKKKDLYLIAHW